MRLLLVLMFVFCVLTANTARAGVTVVQALNFGSWISKNNDAQYGITINTDGSYSFNSTGFIEISPPQVGIFDLDGMTPNTAISSVTIIQTTSLSGSGLDFQMINFTETHSASTDASGIARVTVGATAQTTGGGGSYIDQTYNGQIQIQINF